MLAWPYGTPKVMSSYDWSSQQGTSAGTPTPTNDQGQTLPVSCGDGWVCEHRWPGIANMVEFRNVTQGVATVDYWWDNGNNQIAFARGDRGFVAINNENTDLSQTLMTGLPPGTYCNVLSLPPNGVHPEDGRLEPTLASCETELIEVDAFGNANIEVPPYQSLALHIEAQL
ncbi:MAG: hypothetical protein F6K31_39500 [Symploca sp. SIO2G7]|nr:hypothetical protein [Symploca sp. SIO2G7]